MIALRPATMDDRDLLMQWRKDLTAHDGYPPVTDDEHDRWLRGWVASMRIDTNVGLFIAELAGHPIGTGRITASTINCTDIETPWCHIHYYIDVPYRGKGYGKQLVKELVDKAIHDMEYETVSAKIHRSNKASLQCALMGGVSAVEFL